MGLDSKDNRTPPPKNAARSPWTPLKTPPAKQAAAPPSPAPVSPAAPTPADSPSRARPIPNTPYTPYTPKLVRRSASSLAPASTRRGAAEGPQGSTFDPSSQHPSPYALRIPPPSNTAPAAYGYAQSSFGTNPSTARPSARGRSSATGSASGSPAAGNTVGGGLARTSIRSGLGIPQSEFPGFYQGGSGSPSGTESVFGRSLERKGPFKVGESADFMGRILYPKCRTRVSPPSDWDPQLAERSAQAPTSRLVLEFAHGYDNTSTANNLFFNAEGHAVFPAAALGVVQSRGPPAIPSAAAAAVAVTEGTQRPLFEARAASISPSASPSAAAALAPPPPPPPPPSASPESQSFFLGHTGAVRCLDVCRAAVSYNGQLYPTRTLVATGQASTQSEGPYVSVWDSRPRVQEEPPQPLPFRAAPPPAPPPIIACTQLCRLPFAKEVRGIGVVSFSPDGALLLVITLDNAHSVYLFDWRTGRLLMQGRGYMGQPPQLYGAAWNTHVASGTAPQFVTFGRKHIKLWMREAGPGGGARSEPAGWSYKNLTFGKQAVRDICSAVFLPPRPSGGATSSAAGAAAGASSLTSLIAAGTSTGEIYLFGKGSVLRSIAAHKPGPSLTTIPGTAKSYDGLRCLRLVRTEAEGRTKWILYSGGADGLLQRWDVSDGDLIEGRTAGAAYQLGSAPADPPSFFSSSPASPPTITVTTTVTATSPLAPLYPSSSIRGLDVDPATGAVLVGTSKAHVLELLPHEVPRAAGGSPGKPGSAGGGFKGGRKAERSPSKSPGGSAKKGQLPAPPAPPPPPYTERVLTSGAEADVWGVAFHPRDATLYATTCDASQVILRSTKTHATLARASTGFRGRCVAISSEALAGARPDLPAAHHIAVGGVGGQVLVLACPSLTPIAAFRDPAAPTTMIIMDLKYSPDSCSLAVATSEGHVDVYSVLGGYKRMSRLAGHSSAVKNLDWSRDSVFLKSDSQSYELLCFRATTGDRAFDTNAPAVNAPFATGTCILGFSVMGIWPEGADGTDINAVDRSPDHSLLVTAGDDGLVRLMHHPCVVEGAPSVAARGHASHVMRARWSPDGSSVVSVGAKDRAVLQWRLDKAVPQEVSDMRAAGKTAFDLKSGGPFTIVPAAALADQNKCKGKGKERNANGGERRRGLPCVIM